MAANHSNGFAFPWVAQMRKNHAQLGKLTGDSIKVDRTGVIERCSANEGCSDVKKNREMMKHAVSVNLPAARIGGMNALVERSQLYADGAEVLMAAFEFFHEGGGARVDRGEKEKAVRGPADVSGHGFVGNIPIGGASLQSEYNGHIRCLGGFKVALADIAPFGRINAATGEVGA